MLFERHNLSLPIPTPKFPSQNAIPCHAAGSVPGGQTPFASLGRIAMALLVAFCALFCATASAQTANFAGAMLALPISGLSTPTFTAVDASGNFYITDCANSRVLKETPGANGVYYQSVVADTNNPGLNTPEGVAVDQYGNVYISDIANLSVVKMVPQSNGTYAAHGVTTTTSLRDPYGVAVDANGSIYISDAILDVVLKETPNSTGAGYTETTVASTANTSGMKEPMGIAVDKNGNVYIADASSSFLIIMMPGMTAGTYQQFTGYNSIITLNGATSVTVDANYNIFIGNSGNNNVLEFNNSTQSISTVADEILNNPMGVAVDANDNLFIADSMNNRMVKDSLTGWNFGQVSIGTTSPEIALLFDIDTAGSLGMPAVVTQGTMGLEFADAGNGTCSAISYSADSTCTVGVTFTPAYPGSRYGAADLTASGSTLATGYVQGYGLGGQVNYLPPTQSTPITGVPISGIAVDSSGNMYATDETDGQMAIVAPGQSAAQATVIVSGMTDAAGVAVDGNGNVVVADPGDNVVIMASRQAGGGYAIKVLETSALSSPNGVAVDAWGNVYIADTNNNRVLKETLTAGSYAESTVANAADNGLSYPYAVAVDGSGNVYIADTANNRVLMETTSASGYSQSTVPTPDMNDPISVAVDGDGNLYIAYYESNQIVKETLSGGSYTSSAVPTTGLSGPLAVAVDPKGNVYVADFGNSRIVEEDFSDAPTLSFAPTLEGQTSTDSPKTVTVVNTGNLGMAFDAVIYPFDFPEAEGVNTDCASSTFLNTNASCTLTIDFKPTPASATGTTTALSKSVILQDNLFNPSGVDLRSVTVTGTETEPPPPTIVLSPAALPGGTVGVGYAQQITASGGTAPYTYEQVGGHLPTGMTLGSNGMLNGTPTGGGTFAISVNATDSSSTPGPYNGSASYSLTIAGATIALSPATLPSGTVGAVYSQAITASGGTAPYTYTLTYGTLPVGLTLSSSGTLSGTPTTSGTYPITVNAVDSSTGTGPYSTSQIFLLIIGLEPVAASPTFSVPDGVYASAQTVSLSDAISGATIYYTTDGSTPTAGSTLYGGAITVSNSETIQAIAMASGYSNSSIAAAAYAINLPGNAVASTPTFSVATGTYAVAQTVTISDSTGGAAIYYTTDGTTPTANSAKYNAAITVSATEIVQAIAVAAGYNNSEVASAAYAINLPGTPVAATPTFSVPTGTYTAAQTVTISDSTSGAAIYYTTDGSMPTISSAKFAGAITVSSTESIQAIAVATGYSNSAIASAAYAINLPGNPVAATPTFSVADGIYTSAQSVTISDSTTGAAIYYTTDGSVPTISSAKFAGAITVSSTETIQAIAVASGYNSSAVAAAAYSINLPGTTVAAAPTFSVATGSYTTAQTVKIADTTTGSTIYYTTDGTTPTSNSNLANDPITVSSTETIQAIAVASGYSNSTIAVAAYAINLPGTPVAATPAFSVASGNYAAAQTVSLSDSTIGATIYYTTDGSTPTANSNLAYGPITVSSTETIQAVAVASGYSNSAVASAAYTINQTQVAAPHFSIGTGSYAAAQTVTISDSTAGAAIYYTTDGTTPTANSNLADGPIMVSSTETLTAIAITGGDTNSEVVWATYNINPAAADFTLGASTTSATMLQASPAAFNLTVTPINATSFPSGVTLAATGLPTGATAVFTPANIASGAGSTPVTMTISVLQSSALTQPAGSMIGKFAPFSLALLLLPFAGRLRKSGKRLGRILTVLLLLVAGMAGVAGMSGCSSSNGIFGTMPKAYTVTVTGTMGTVSHSTTTILIVQ